MNLELKRCIRYISGFWSVTVLLKGKFENVIKKIMANVPNPKEVKFSEEHGIKGIHLKPVDLLQKTCY